MEATPALVLSGVQAAIIVLLAVDRWVHQVTGKQSIESRVTVVEEKLTRASDKLSDEFGKIQAGIIDIQIAQAQQEQHLKGTDTRLDDLRLRVDRFHGIS